MIAFLAFVWRLKCHPLRFAETRERWLQANAWDEGYRDGLKLGAYGIDAFSYRNPYEDRR